MSHEFDTAVGRAAVQKGFITQQQCDESLRVVEMVIQAGLTRSLADILVEKSLVTQMQADVLKRAAGGGDVRIIGGYELLDKLGEGGMGAVYKARQISMDRLVALKLLPDRLAKDKEFTARFLREARVAAKLDHVNIVRGIDVGQDGENYYFAMEFVEGESVAQRLKRQGRIPEKKALGMIMQVAWALDHAASHQLIHRDIKPDNIFLTTDDTAKMGDLGLARSTDDESAVMTRTGMAVGTPHYISPEQARGEKNIDIRTDIYSLGATLYHMVVGDTPFNGSTAAVIITQHLTEEPPAACTRNSAVTKECSRIIAMMMAKDASQRYDNPRQLIEDLELVIDGKEPKYAPDIDAVPSAIPTMQMDGEQFVGTSTPSRTKATRVPGAMGVGSATKAARAPGSRSPSGMGGASGASLISAAQLQDLESQVMLTRQKAWILPAVIGGGVLVIALGVIVAVLALGGRKLEDEAARELASIRMLVSADKLDAALTDAMKGATRYAETSRAAEFTAIVEDITKREKDAAAAAKAAEAEAAAAKERSAKEHLTRAARTVLDRAKSQLAEKKFAEARGTLELGSRQISDAELDIEKVDLLGQIAAAEKAEAERIAGEKATAEAAQKTAVRTDQDKAWLDLIARGDKHMAERGFKPALEAYQSAADLKSTPELERKMEDARFESAVADGKSAQDRGELAFAAEEYRKALKIRENEGVRARLKGVLDALKRVELEGLVAKVNQVDAAKSTSKDDIEAALEAAKKALEIAGEKETADLEAHAKALDAALKYTAAIYDARQAAANREWKTAEVAADVALRSRPGDAEATEILTRAKAKMNKPREMKVSLGLAMVWVPSGEFTMGSESGDEDERPVHRVRLKGFYMSRTEITNAQYEKFDREHGTRRSEYSPGENTPVINVTWRDAVGFCRWLSREEGKEFRLPTEAEWEYAARGTDDRKFPWGNDEPSAGGQYRANFGEGKTDAMWKADGHAYAAPVGSFKNGASPFGVMDLAGNVWEWCADWYGPYQNLGEAQRDPTGPQNGTERALRGGSWYHDGTSMRCANRWSKEPNRMSSSVGFRVVAEAQ